MCRCCLRPRESIAGDRSESTWEKLMSRDQENMRDTKGQRTMHVVIKKLIYMVDKRDCVRMEREVEFGRESEFGKFDRDKERDELYTCKRGFLTWVRSPKLC